MPIWHQIPPHANTPYATLSASCNLHPLLHFSTHRHHVLALFQGSSSRSSCHSWFLLFVSFSFRPRLEEQVMMLSSPLLDMCCAIIYNLAMVLEPWRRFLSIWWGKILYNDGWTRLWDCRTCGAVQYGQATLQQQQKSKWSSNDSVIQQSKWMEQ